MLSKCWSALTDSRKTDAGNAGKNVIPNHVFVEPSVRNHKISHDVFHRTRISGIGFS